MATIINESYNSEERAGMGRQAVVNGNFDIWQKGNSFTNVVTGAYTADKFLILHDDDGGTLPTNLIHSKQEFTAGVLANSFNYYRFL